MLCDRCQAEIEADLEAEDHEIPCHIDGCSNTAVWEMWLGVGGDGMCTKALVCNYHKAEELRKRAARAKKKGCICPNTQCPAHMAVEGDF